jgi:protocatechuate 3,4-dioxygenase beta subunit
MNRLKHFYAILLILALGMILTTCEEERPLEPIVAESITGRVVDGQGNPLQGIQVFLYRGDTTQVFDALPNGSIRPGTPLEAQTVSGSDGRFEFRNVPVGTYTIVVQAQGVPIQRVTRQVTCDGAKNIDTGTFPIGNVISDCPAITGRVLDTSGNPVPNARVFLYVGDPATVLDASGNVRAGTPLRAETRTGTDGRFTFTNVPSGTFTIVTQIDGFKPIARRAQCGDNGDFRFTATNRVNVEGPFSISRWDLNGNFGWRFSDKANVPDSLTGAALADFRFLGFVDPNNPNTGGRVQAAQGIVILPTENPLDPARPVPTTGYSTAVFTVRPGDVIAIRTRDGRYAKIRVEGLSRTVSGDEVILFKQVFPALTQ